MNKTITASKLLAKIHEATNSEGISFNIPAFTRVLEYSRENIKSDNELHEFIENLSIKYNQVGSKLTMNDIEELMPNKG